MKFHFRINLDKSSFFIIVSEIEKNLYVFRSSVPMPCPCRSRSGWKSEKENGGTLRRCV